MEEKIGFYVNKDIADHPKFQQEFLKLVAKYEEEKDIICRNCGHNKFSHTISKQNGYCRICYKEGKKNPCMSNRPKRFKEKTKK